MASLSRRWGDPLTVSRTFFLCIYWSNLVIYNDHIVGILYLYIIYLICFPPSPSLFFSLPPLSPSHFLPPAFLCGHCLSYTWHSVSQHPWLLPLEVSQYLAVAPGLGIQSLLSMRAGNSPSSYTTIVGSSYCPCQGCTAIVWWSCHQCSATFLLTSPPVPAA